MLVVGLSYVMTSLRYVLVALRLFFCILLHQQSSRSSSSNTRARTTQGITTASIMVLVSSLGPICSVVGGSGVMGVLLAVGAVLVLAVGAVLVLAVGAVLVLAVGAVLVLLGAGDGLVVVGGGTTFTAVCVCVCFVCMYV